MITNLALGMLLSLLALVVITCVALSVFPEEQAPRLLRPIVRKVQAAFALLEEVLDSFDGDQAMPAHAAPVPQAYASARGKGTPAAPKVLDLQQERFFLLQELSIHCKFEPRIEGDALIVSKRQLSRLVDYCNFAFDAPQTPKQVLGSVGLTLKTE